jgi:hypothetical protein
MLRYVTLCTIVLLGCSDEKHGCPSKLAQRAEWRSVNAVPECSELASTLTAESSSPNDVSPDCPDDVIVEERDGQCVASFASACDGVTLELECRVQSSGAADCDASISGDGIPSCRLALRLR